MTQRQRSPVKQVVADNVCSRYGRTNESVPEAIGFGSGMYYESTQSSEQADLFLLSSPPTLSRLSVVYSAEYTDDECSLECEEECNTPWYVIVVNYIVNMFSCVCSRKATLSLISEDKFDYIIMFFVVCLLYCNNFVLCFLVIFGSLAAKEAIFPICGVVHSYLSFKGHVDDSTSDASMLSMLNGSRLRKRVRGWINSLVWDRDLPIEPYCSYIDRLSEIYEEFEEDYLINFKMKFLDLFGERYVTLIVVTLPASHLFRIDHYVYPFRLLRKKLEDILALRVNRPVVYRRMINKYRYPAIYKFVCFRPAPWRAIHSALDNGLLNYSVYGMIKYTLRGRLIPGKANGDYVKFRIMSNLGRYNMVLVQLQEKQAAARRINSLVVLARQVNSPATPAASVAGSLMLLKSKCGETLGSAMEFFDEMLYFSFLHYFWRFVPEKMYYFFSPDEYMIDKKLGHELVFLSRDRKRSHYKSSKELRGSFKIFEGNFSHNVNALRRAYKKPKRPMQRLKLYGRTEFEGISLPFPVYCDYKTFHRVMNSFELERKMLERWIVGDFSERDMYLLEPLFRTVLHEQVIPTMGVEEFGPVSLLFSIIVAQICFNLTDVNLQPYFLLAGFLHIASNFLGLKAHHFLYAIYEETLNSVFGLGPIIAFEFGGRGSYNFTQQLMVVCGHLFMSTLPFPIRVLVHYMWNNTILNHEHGGLVFSSVLSLRRIAITSSALDLVRKMFQKDYTGVALWLGIHCEWISESLELENIDLTAFVDDFSKPIAEEGEELFFLNNETDAGDPHNKYDFLFHWIPISVKKSPTFKRIVALLIMVMSTSYFQAGVMSTRIGSYLTSEDFQVHGSIVSLISSTFTSMVKAVGRVLETGSFGALWDLPYDVYFTSKATQLLLAPAKAESTEDITNKIADARHLIDSVLYSKKTIEMNRLCEKLEKYIVDKREFIDAQASRDQPFPIWLNGGPGTGKTTLMELICDFLAKLKNFKRFPGDVVKANVQEKFLVATGAHPDANFLFLNDIPNIYSDFDKRDLLPLDILLQQVIDTFPLSFRQAAVEQKGKLMKSIKFVIITSNHYSFVCPGETEKLERRLDYGMLLDVRLMKGNKEIKDAKEVRKMSVAQRNDCTRFEIMSVSCEGHRILFKGTQKFLTLPEMFNYLAKLSEQWDLQVKRTAELFSVAAKRCDCGLPLASHITDMAPEVCYDIEGRTAYRALTERCNDFFCDHANFPPTTLGVSFWFDPVQTPHTMYMSLESFLGIVAACMVIFYSKWLSKMIDEAIEFYAIKNIESMASRYVLRHPLFDKVFSPCYSDRTNFYLKALRFYHKCKEFMLEYKWVLGGSTILLASLKALRSEKEWAELSKPIYVSEVDPDSMNRINYRKEINYPVDKAREWGKAEMEMTVGVVQTGGVSGENLGSMLPSHIFEVSVVTEYDDESTATVDGKIFALSPEYVAFNKHYLPEKNEKDVVARYMMFRGHKFYFADSELKSNNDNEFYLWKHNLPIAVRGLQKFLPLVPIAFRVEVSRNGVDWIPAIPVTANLAGVAYKSLSFRSDEKQGDCATPYLARVVGTTLLAGAVSAGDLTGTVVITLFSREWLDALTATDPFPFVEDLHMLGRDVGALSLNSEGRNVISPFLIPLGSDNLPGRSFSSKFRKSKLYEDVAPLLKEPYDYPRKTRVVSEGEYHSAFTQTFRYLNLESNLTREEAYRGVKMMVEDLFSRLPGNGKNMKVSFLSLEEAIFGNPTLGIDRINFKTSCGRELKSEFGIKNKYDLFTYTEGEHFPYALKEEVSELMSEIDSRVRKGICEIAFVEAAEKDELRPVDKLKKAKIRLFSVLNAVFNLYGRMGLMAFITILLQNPQASECYGAMNAGSAEWDNLAKTLQVHENFGDLDFSSFDVCHYDGIAMFACFTYLCLLKLGMAQECAKACYIFIIGMRWQMFYYRGDYYLKMKGMPSGVIITLIMNSIVNSILFRIAYSRTSVPKAHKFISNVVLGTVGDDNINSISNRVAKWVDLLILAEIYKQLGYVVTPARKGAEMRKKLDFGELTFLKRRFLKNEDLGYVAPIEEDSIYKGMAFEKLDAGVSLEQRLDDVIRGGQREFFLHGREAFDRFQNLLDVWEKKHRCQFTRLEYTDLVVEYKNKAFRTFML